MEASDDAPSSSEQLYRERFIAAVLEGLADEEAGRVISDEDLWRELEAELGGR